MTYKGLRIYCKLWQRDLRTNVHTPMHGWMTEDLGNAHTYQLRFLPDRPEQRLSDGRAYAMSISMLRTINPDGRVDYEVYPLT